ncbi:MAG: metal-sensitive transcriptional regulator [Planctomycetota bacterium]
MALCGTDQDKERLIKRLNRIEGQIKGLKKLVEDDKSCIDVLRQVSSASGSLKGVWLQMIEDHMHGCLKRAVLDGGKDDVHELVEQLRKL